MNIGLREAHELATLVADDMAGKPGMGARLNEYGQQRLAEWRRLFGIEGGLAPIQPWTHQSWNRGDLGHEQKRRRSAGLPVYKYCCDTRGRTLVREVLMNVCTLRSMIVVAGILALSVVAHAQGTKLSGVVTDSTGKPVAGAQVRALLPGPGDNTDVVTDARGQYEVPVHPGDWVISVEMEGLATERKQLEVTDRQIASVGSDGLGMNFTLRSADAAAADFTPARTPDGQVDISGNWVDNHATGDSINYDLETGHRSVEHYRGRSEQPVAVPQGGDVPPELLAERERAAITPLQNAEHSIVDPPGGRIPYQPWALAERNHNQSVYQNPPSADYISGRSKCWLPGSPGFSSSGNPLIVQTPGYVIMSIEFSHAYRIIPLGPLDQNPHVGSNIQLMSGDSRGWWEGNTLVVDVANMKGQWLDLLGNFRTDAAHVVERWTLMSPTQLRYEATIDDPAYTQPMKVVFNYNKRENADYEFFENACHEGNAAYTETVLQPNEK
jgi:hypothetical protein